MSSTFEKRRASRHGRKSSSGKYNGWQNIFADALSTAGKGIYKSLFTHGNWAGLNFSAGKVTPEGYVPTKEDMDGDVVTKVDAIAKVHDLAYFKAEFLYKKDLNNPDISSFEREARYRKAIKDADQSAINAAKNIESEWGGEGIAHFYIEKAFPWHVKYQGAKQDKFDNETAYGKRSEKEHKDYLNGDSKGIDWGYYDEGEGQYDDGQNGLAVARRKHSGLSPDRPKQYGPGPSPVHDDPGPEYRGPDIGADGDFGGSGGYRGDGRYSPPTSDDDFNPRYESDDDDIAFDPVPDVGVDADFGGAGGYNGGSVDAGNNDVDADDDDFSGMDMDNWAFPVIIDLDGDGIQIIPVGESRAQFDMDDSGRKQIMAWAGPDDALLVFDEDNDRLITTRNEFAFAEYLENAKTDLEGLAWFDQFSQGGNEDGVLDERDAMWSKFGLWRDANQNGVTDPGELRMSGEGGLQSVNLKSDQRSYEAGPDARVFGRGAYTAQDESGQTRTGDLYDTALRHEESPEPLSAAEIFYPSKPVELTPEQQGYRRMRKDGQPISDAEIFYPDASRAHEYTYVWNDMVTQRERDADLLYDHPTSRPKK